MAEIAYEPTVTTGGDWLITWPTVTESDTFQRYELDRAVSEISVHTVGTFGSATVLMKGSNYAATGVTLTQMSGADASVTAEDIYSVLDRPRYITPTHSGGSSESVTIYMMVRR